MCLTPCRYLYICRLKNTGFFDDDLIYTILVLLVYFFPFYFSALFTFSGMRVTPIWRKCAGNPEILQGDSSMMQIDN